MPQPPKTSHSPSASRRNQHHFMSSAFSGHFMMYLVQQLSCGYARPHLIGHSPVSLGARMFRESRAVERRSIPYLVLAFLSKRTLAAETGKFEVQPSPESSISGVA